MAAISPVLIPRATQPVYAGLADTARFVIDSIPLRGGELPFHRP
jgi:hypothetical protein